MSGTGDWYAGTYLKYTITQNPNDPDGTPNFKYDYYFIEYGSTPLDGVNAMLLEFSLSCDTDPACFRDDPHPYQPGDIAHLPAGINAAEWDADNADNRGVYGFHFLSDRTPVWGNFFAVGADYNAWSYNPGLMNPNQKFCSVDHKTEYHFHTPDFRKLEQEFIRMVRRMVRPECLK